QAELRPPRGESSGEEARDGESRDHVAEPRLRRRSEVAAEGRRGHAPQFVRRHRRGTPAQEASGFLRAVSSRSLARPARCGLPLRRLPRDDRKAWITFLLGHEGTKSRRILCTRKEFFVSSCLRG